MIHRRLLQLAGLVPGRIALVALSTLSLTALHVAFAVQVAAMLGLVIAQDAQAAFDVLPWLVATAAARGLATWFREVLAARCGIAIRARLRDRLFAQLTALGPAYSRGERLGAVTATLVDGVDGLDAYYSRYLPQLIVVLVVPAALTVAVAGISPGAGVILGIAILVAVAAPRFWDARLLRTGRSRWVEFERLSGAYLEALQSMPLLRIFGAAERTGAELRGRDLALYRRTMGQLRISLVESGVSSLVLHVGTVLAVLVAAAGAVDGDRSATALVAVLLLSRECFRPIVELAGHWHAGYLGLAAVDGLDELMSATPGVIDGGKRVTPAERGSTVSFESVSFRHPGTVRGVHGVSFTVHRGGVAALSGPSGSGKSTLARLLIREHDPDAGTIRLDGIALPEYSLEALHRSVILIPQDTVLFARTIAENLRLHRPDASDAEMAAAARAAQIDDVIDALPDGYATVLDEDGARLSGGQRQRIAIARALLAAPAVLVLDEATSALDVETEARVIAGVRRALPECTIIVIAHRETATTGAIQRLVVRDGRVAEWSPEAGS